MKKTKMLFAALLIALFGILSLTACAIKEPVQLDTPRNLTANATTKILTWSPVENAKGYRVQVGYQILEETTVANFSLENLEEGIYEIQVQAIGDDMYYYDSEWTQPINYTLGVLTISIVNMEEVYTLDDSPFPMVQIGIGNTFLSDYTVTWSSENTAVALIDADTGTVTLNDTGTATITASAEVDGKPLTDSFTFDVFKGLKKKLYLTGLSYQNSGGGSHADGSFTYSAASNDQTGFPKIRTVQAYGTGSDYSNATFGAVGKLVDDFCRDALDAPIPQLFLTIAFQHSQNNGSLRLRIRGYGTSGNGDDIYDYILSTHGGYSYQNGKRTMTFDLLAAGSPWAGLTSSVFKAGLAIMWNQEASGSVRIYDAFLHTSQNMSGNGEAKDGIFIQNAQFFRTTSSTNNGNGLYAGADTLARLKAANGGKRTLTVGSYADFAALNASNAQPIWKSGNPDIVEINSSTGEITFKTGGDVYISVIYKVGNAIYGDKILMSVPN